LKELRFLLVIGGIALAGLTGMGQTPSYRPVTNAMLLNPDPADWLHFRRTLDAQGYSPLNQINRDNVSQLQLVWSWTMHPGMTETTPHVHDGIMFVPNANGGVQALNAATGDLLWDFHLPLVKLDTPAPAGGAAGAPQPVRRGLGNSAGPSRPVRNLAFWGDKVYVGTSVHHGGRLVALNAHTGAIMWDRTPGFDHSGGPIAVNGKIVVGTTGCEYYKKEDPPCHISATDAETGQVLWKTSTIQRPGDPGPDSWSGLPLEFRAGGDNWQAGSYDPKTNLTYWGTAQGKPWIPFQRGTDGAALYTSSTLALNVDTGKMEWYYQHIPGESFDMDETFERVLIDYDGRSSVFSMGKIGILWELDRRTGAFRAAHDLGYQDQGTIDPKTGQLTYFPGRLPQPGVPISFCPGVSGFKTWRAMAYHPQTQAVYVPLLLWCTSGVPAPASTERIVGGRGASGFRNSKSSFHPKSPDDLGEFAAMDIKTGKVLWRHRTRTPPTTSALTTGGGLVVVGNYDRTLYIYDAANGNILYQTRLPGPAVGSPTTYAVGGRQYLAIPLGTGSDGGWMSTPRRLAPDVRVQEWDEYPTGVMVFALPQN